MKSIQKLRTSIRDFEDRKITASQLGREVLHAANTIQDPTQARLRQVLVRLGHRLNALFERAMHDDIADEVRGIVDDLHAELVDLT